MKIDIYQKTKCSSCGESIDKFDADCPKCNERNNDFPLGEKARNMVFLNPIKQLILFLFGWVGLNIISVAVSRIVIACNLGDKLLIDALINFICYGTLFIGFVFILWKDSLKILKKFKNGKSWLIGLAIFGVMLVFNISVNLILKAAFPNEIGQNQSSVNSITKTYPILSTIFFAFIGPICEELTYRLGLFSLLRRRNRVIAYVASSLIFGLIHFGWSTIGTNAFFIELATSPVYIGMGVILGLSYDLFGPAPTIIAHVLNNSFGIVPAIFEKFLNIK